MGDSACKRQSMQETVIYLLSVSNSLYFELQLIFKDDTHCRILFHTYKKL